MLDSSRIYEKIFGCQIILEEHWKSDLGFKVQMHSSPDIDNIFGHSLKSPKFYKPDRNMILTAFEIYASLLAWDYETVLKTSNNPMMVVIL